MSLQDPPRSELEELREIADKASRVIPRYRQQNAALKVALQEKEEELAKYKKLYAENLSELEQYKQLYKKTQTSSEFYKEECEGQRKKIIHLYLTFGFVLLLVFAYLFVLPIYTPSDDVVRIKPTEAPTYSFQSTIGKAAAAKSASQHAQTAKPSAQKSEIYVWIPNSGKRYHDSKGCSGMNNPKYVPISEAKRLGYTPCGTCDPPR